MDAMEDTSMAQSNRCGMFLLLFTAIGISGLGQPSSRAAEGLDRGLVAYWQFDEGEGDVCENSSPNRIPARLHGPKWVKGKYGGALSLDGKDDWVDCSNNALLRIRKALTVTAWIQPNIKGQQYVVSKFGWSIYLGGDPLLVHFETRNAADDGWSATLDSRLGIPVNEWSFIAVVYDPAYDPAKPARNQEVYVNGLLMKGQSRGETMGGVDAVNLVIGRYAANKSQWFSGLVDEVRIYKRALSGQEIMRLHLFRPKPPARQLRLTPRLVFSKGKVLLDIDFRALRPLPQNALIDVKLTRPGVEEPLRRREVRRFPASGKTDVTFDTADLEPGDYEIQAAVAGAQVRQEPVVAKFTWPRKPEWLGSKEGISDKVLRPWTPVAVNKAESLTVKTWGRSYEFGSQPFLDGVVTKGRSILAGPIRLIAKINGDRVAWRSEPVKLMEESPAKVKLAQRASCPGLVLSAQTEIEYDGMMRIDWHVEAKQAVNLEEMTLEIPLSAKHAEYLFSYPYGLCGWFTYPGDRRPGVLPKNSRAVGHMVPVLWMGDETLGLGCFWESTRNWFNADPDKSTEVAHEGDRVVIRFHLVDTPTRLEPEKKVRSRGKERTGPARLDYTFALQATPVKPVEKTCWDYRIASCPWYGRDYELLTKEIEGRPALEHLAERGVRTLLLLNWTDVMAYVRPVGHEEDLRRLVKEAHERGIKVILYFGFQLSEKAPEWPVFKDEVIATRTVPDLTVRGIDRYPGEPEQFVNRICYNSVMQDLLVDGIARLMDEYDIDGVYLDSTAYPQYCLNRLHGCGYVKPDGTLVGTHAMFAIRETLKRIYTVVKARKPDGLVDVHGTLNIPALAWATSYYNGEGLPRVGNHPILDAVPLDHFRVEFMGHQWGVPAEFLHYTLLGHDPESYRKAHALSLLHDVPVRLHAQAENLEFASSIWRLFETFGRQEAEWLPYWKNSEYISVQPEGVYASLYRHPRNGVLIVASNLVKKEANVTLKLNLQKLGLGAEVTARDGLSKESVVCEGNRIKLTLPYLHWKVIWLKSK